MVERFKCECKDKLSFTTSTSESKCARLIHFRNCTPPSFAAYLIYFEDNCMCTHEDVRKCTAAAAAV